MTEVQVVEWLKRLAPATGSGVVLGIGDDCAIFRPRGSAQDLLFTTDQFIEGVHFRRSDSPESVGHRALGRGLSDIAAMGGTPRFSLTSLTKPRNVSDAWLRRFYAGLVRLASRFHTVLAGGDLASGPTLACDVVVCGSVRRNGALRRDRAKPGDTIYVSGPLGGPASRNYPPRLFPPKVKLGQRLLGKATACIDITDGLALDLHRLCVASGVSAKLEKIPLVAGASVEHALSGGDEYELLFTGRELGSFGIPVGVIEAGEPSFVQPSGYDHFRG
ncbi:MAG TPA: thiamine-phosphate kinase [Bryobacteraceae bacterium]|nr:thiamine-phosphate kinase [Bryobacteraceae bacterium]